MQSCDARKKHSIVVGLGFENDHGYSEITSINGIKCIEKDGSLMPTSTVLMVSAGLEMFTVFYDPTADQIAMFFTSFMGL
jgi:hypothetical protein